MKFNEEQITEIGLSEEQVSKVEGLTETNEAELKKDWDGKANTDAEAIIQGAADKVEALTGIKREQGIKIADYLPLASENYLKGQKATLERKEEELDEKIKKGGGDETLKQKLKDTEELLDGFKQKAAKYDEWEKEDYKGKFETTSEKLSGMRLEVAYSGVKPNFPDTVNSYEAQAKWAEFKNNTNSTHNVEIDKDNVAWVIDKTNEHSRKKLSDLVKANETISKLSAGREAKGLGAGKTNIEIEGVPFKVPENATPIERQKAIKEYLTGELKLATTSNEYTKQYSELNKKLMEKTPKK